MVTKVFFIVLLIFHQGNVTSADNNEAEGVVQYLKIFRLSCTGDPLAELATSGNVTFSSSSYTYAMVNGLWSIQTCSGGGCSTPQVLNDFGTRCFSLTSSTVYVIQRHGDPFQIEHSIHLFPLPHLTGNKVIVRENTNIPEMSVGSYFFTGLASWTLNGSPNGGESHCLEPWSSVTTNGYGFTYATQASISVASVGTGCAPPTTPRPIDGNCTRPGIYYVPYNGDCRKFMMCHNGYLVPEVQECPEGTLFDEEFGDCNLEAEVECKPSCPAEGTFTFPHSRNCSLYWLCIFGDRILRQCATGLAFDSSAGLCNLEELVMCPNTCPPEGSVNLPHAGDCQLYWSCSSGTPTLNRCQPGYLFNPAQGHCYPDDLVECGTPGV